jgi:hypothetical protein
MDVYAHLKPGEDQKAAKRTDTGLRKALESRGREGELVSKRKLSFAIR